MMFKPLVIFLKNPVYQADANQNPTYRTKIFFSLLVLAMGLSLLLGILIGILDSISVLDFGPHALDGFTASHSPVFIILAAVVLAPVLEELLFRWPLVLFRDSRYFYYIFYAFLLLFGFYHLLNFQVSATVLLFSPILVAPQIVVGAILGYLRIQFGLLWSILLHASYNLLLIGPLLLQNQDQFAVL